MVGYFYNGDIRESRIKHFERACGRCRDRAACVNNMYAAAVEGGLLQSDTNIIPIKHRFGSSTAALSQQCAGVMVHQLFPQTAAKAFPNFAAAAPAAAGDTLLDGDDDRRRYNRRKVWRCKHKLADSEFLAICLATLWATQPADWLWKRLQYEDAGQNSVLELVSPSSSPILRVQRELLNMCALPCNQGHLAPLWRHFSPHPRLRAIALSRACEIAVAIAAQIWLRCVLPLFFWPFKLLDMVTGARDPDEVASEFGYCETCCPDCCLFFESAQFLRVGCRACTM